MRRALHSQRGITLIELVITISLMATLVAIAVPAVGALTGAKLRAASSGLAGAIRFGYDLASRRQLTVRLVLDMDENAYWLEASSDPFRLGREKTEVRGGRAVEKEEKRSRRLVSRSDIESGEFWQPRPPASFQVLEGQGARKVALEDVTISDVWTEHQQDRISGGQAYLYFFPGGLTQEAVIHLGDEAGNNFTLFVEPLLGTVRVEPGYLEAEEE